MTPGCQRNCTCTRSGSRSVGAPVKLSKRGFTGITNLGMEMHFCTTALMCLVRVQNITHGTKIVEKFFLKCCRGYSQSQFKPVTRKFIINTPRTMKLDSPHFSSCITEEVLTLNKLFESIGHEVRIVGGAVRDLLMGIQPKDLDFATTATPQEMKDMFTENKIRLINTNGEKHGTITSRINESNFEVTTLRVDVSTNGRHAEVEFTKEWVLDANRRDLTINAMYLGLDGTVYDYFNGYDDLKKKRVVFVGDAAARIQEDYLRILRYFRFFGKISDRPDSHDEDMLQAIRENRHGLEKISGERIWMELSKILTGRFHMEIVLKMISLDLGEIIGFPAKCNEEEFRTVCNRLKMKDVTAHPVTLLAALFDTVDDLTNFFTRIKPSGFERDLGLFILNHRKETVADTILAYKVLLATTSKRDYVKELLKYQGKFELLEKLEEWVVPKFPVNGHQLKDRGIKGPAIGTVLDYLRKLWFESNFSASADELLKHALDVEVSVSEQPKPKRRK